MEIDAAAIKFNEFTEKLQNDFIIRKEVLIRNALLEHGLNIEDVIIEEYPEYITIYRKGPMIRRLYKFGDKIVKINEVEDD